MSPKMGQKIKENPKNVRLDLRLTKREAEDLQYCAEKLNKHRTSIINAGVAHIMEKIREEEKKMQIKINIGKEKRQNLVRHTTTDMAGRVIGMEFRDGLTNIVSIADEDDYLIVTINNEYVESAE